MRAKIDSPNMADNWPKASKVVVGVEKLGRVGERKSQRNTGQIDIITTNIKPSECLNEYIKTLSQTKASSDSCHCGRSNCGGFCIVVNS